MRIFSRLKFRTKLNIGMSSILVVMAALLLPLVGRMTVETLVEENKLRGQALSESLAARAVEPMLALDFLRLKNMVDEQIAVGDVVYVFVQDAVGHVLAHTFHKGFPLDLIRANSVENGQKIHIQLLADGASRIYDFASPVVVGTDRIGTVRIGLSKTRINATVHRQLTMVAGFLFRCVAVGRNTRKPFFQTGCKSNRPTQGTCRVHAHGRSGYAVRTV